jgi:hypothetical protein
MNRSRRLIVKDSPITTAENISVPILPRVSQIHLKSKKGLYRHTEQADRTIGEKCRDKQAMTAKLERDIVAEFSIPIILFSGYLS